MLMPSIIAITKRKPNAAKTLSFEMDMAFKCSMLAWPMYLVVHMEGRVACLGYRFLGVHVGSYVRYKFGHVAWQ